jgi:RNA polymerase sigma-70 factor, ECF subfamily
MPRTEARTASLPNPLLAALYAHENPALLRYLTRLARCPERAADVAQAAWLKLLAGLQAGTCQLTETSELRAYLYVVARNTYLDEYTRKHEHRRVTATDPAQLPAVADEADRPDQALERLQMRRDLGRALAQLPQEQRRVMLGWSCGLGLTELARDEGAPVETIHSRRKYALARLRQHWSQGHP